MRKSVLVAATVLLGACATVKSGGPIDQSEPRRVVGTDNDVRIDAEVVGDQLSPAMILPLKYEITNNRQAAIAVADLIPETTYDEDTRVVTISLGSEVPGATLLPHLIRINAGEKKSFTAIARVNIMLPTGTPLTPIPRELRLKLNFLSDTTQFEALIDMTEKGLYDPKLADELFPKWLERNETVYTNSLPMHWVPRPQDDSGVPASRRNRRPGTSF